MQLYVVRDVCRGSRPFRVRLVSALTEEAKWDPGAGHGRWCRRADPCFLLAASGARRSHGMGRVALEARYKQGFICFLFGYVLHT